jgi:hypothetical protein
MATICDHSGTHSGATRYLRDTGQLRLVVVCDDCGCECGELTRVDYAPQPVDTALLGRGEHAHAAAPPAA